MDRWLVMLLALALAGSLRGQETSLLDDREWKSADGHSLQASLLEVKGDWVTLERKRDNRSFKLAITRLSVDDRALIEKCEKELDQLIRSSNGSGVGTTTRFIGFPNPSEKIWELARRFGRAGDLWKQATQADWFFHAHGGQRVIRVRTQRIERISDAEYYVHGEHLTLKVRLDDLEERLSFHGNRLVRTDSRGNKTTVAQTGVDFLPMLGRENLLSFGMEKVGVVERLVMSVSLRS